MRWAATQRQKYIAATLATQGYINRSDLIAEFGISVPQASMDLSTWKAHNPGKVEYNATTKRYEAVKA